MKVAPIKEETSFDVFEKLDIRVGTIESVEEIEGADKLMCLKVNFGDHHRNIVAGIKQERENPKEIEGLQALFAVNLPSRKMKGILSEGMMFDIGYADGIQPALSIPERVVPNGKRAG